MNPASLDRLLWWSRKDVPDHPQTRTVATGAADIRVRDTGADGPTVVFLCDPPVTVEHYDELIATLGPAYRVVVLELPGFGFSRTRSAEALEFEGAVAAVEAALSRVVDGPMVVCAPCICGFVGTELAVRGVLDVTGLVLIQTPSLEEMVAWTERMDPDGRLRRPYLGQLLLRATATGVVRKWFRYVTGEETSHAEMAETSVDVLSAGGSYPLATMFQRWGRGLETHGVELPALAVWGTQDRSHPSTDTESTLTHVPAARLTEFDTCGHFPELEDPAGFTEELRPFLRGVFVESERRESA